MPLVMFLVLNPTLEPSSVWIYCLKDQFVCSNRSRPSRSQRVFHLKKPFPKKFYRVFPSRPIVRLWRRKPCFHTRRIGRPDAYILADKKIHTPIWIKVASKRRLEAYRFSHVKNLSTRRQCWSRLLFDLNLVKLPAQKKKIYRSVPRAIKLRSCIMHHGSQEQP